MIQPADAIRPAEQVAPRSSGSSMFKRWRNGPSRREQSAIRSFSTAVVPVSDLKNAEPLQVWLSRQMFLNYTTVFIMVR